MHLLLRFYRLGLRVYPRRFRARYGEEMSRVFDERLHAVSQSGRISTLLYCVEIGADLAASAARERCAELDRTKTIGGFSAILAGSVAAYVDFHATEVQATLLVLLAMSFILGCLMPKGAWRWALMIAVVLPSAHLAALVLHGVYPNEGHPYISRLMIFAPAAVACFIGGYTGALLRFAGGRVAKWFWRTTRSGPSG